MIFGHKINEGMVMIWELKIIDDGIRAWSAALSGKTKWLSCSCRSRSVRS